LQHGYTALIWAAKKGHIAIVTALLAVPGIDLDAKDSVRSSQLCASLTLSSMITRSFPLAFYN
jgi:ankyrin repeat protein